MQSDSLRPIRRRAGRAEFFSVRQELEAKILLGHNLTMLYIEYVDRFSFGYVQFTRYIACYCKQSRSFIMTGVHGVKK